MKFEFKGIIRQIEDTGRIVIPKEMRNTLRVKTGDKMEMCVFGDVLCLKKVMEEKTNG